MKPIPLLIACLAVLVIAIAALWWWLSPAAHQRQIAAETEARLTAELDSATQAAQLSVQREQLALAEAERIKQEMAEARRLVEAASEKEEKQRQAELAALQGQLQREAAARAQAEKSLEELRTKISELEKATREAEERQRELEQARQAADKARAATEAGADSGEISAVRPSPEPTVSTAPAPPPPTVEPQLSEADRLAEQREALARLTRQQAALEEEVGEARRRQWQVEDQITARGGVVERPLPRVWSPNHRPSRQY